LRRPAVEGPVPAVGPRARLHGEGRGHADTGSGGLRRAGRPAGTVAAPLPGWPRRREDLRLPAGTAAGAIREGWVLTPLTPQPPLPRRERGASVAYTSPPTTGTAARRNPMSRCRESGARL